MFEDDDGDIDEVARAFFLAEAPGTAAADIDDDERSFAIRGAPCLCGIGAPPGGRSSIIAAATSSSVVADEDARAFVEPLRWLAATRALRRGTKARGRASSRRFCVCLACLRGRV